LNLLACLLLSVIAYQSPVHYEISLAGNFGEPRPNHFHGGIDIKTGGIEGKPIFSIGDGYVSCVTVGVGGYGNAVYIRHPEGYTSVYAHLKKFAPQIEANVKQWQYAHQSTNATLVFSPTAIPVSRGQLIAVSGNSGASQAPHLHLEVHHTHSWDMMDPLDFIGEKVKDALPPMAHGFMVYPVAGEGSFCGGAGKQSFPFTSYYLERKFTAWGKVGFGIWANDYMESTYNRYGVRKTELYVDGTLAFRSDVKCIPADLNLMVNSWGDYEHFLRYNVWYMRSYVKSGVSLPIFTTNKERGIVDFNQERDYLLTYVLTDFKGNERKYSFTVSAKRAPLTKQAIQQHPLKTLRWNTTNFYQLPGMQLSFGIGFLAENKELSPTIRRGIYSDQYSFTHTSLPLFHYAGLAIRLKKAVSDPSKLYIVSHSSRDRFMGGFYKNGWVHGKARELGATYEIAYDDIPPTITPINQGAWDQKHIVTLGVNDNQSGIESYKGYMDGRFILFKEVPKSPWVRCNLQETPIRRTGKLHRFKFILQDNRGNVRIFTSQIKY